MTASSFSFKYLVVIFLVLPLYGITQTLFLPNTFSDKRKGKEIKEDVAFYTYPFKGSKIDLKDFKKKHPKLKAPNELEIQPPQFINIEDVTILIGLIHGVEANEEALIIWLARDFNKNEVTFFLDKDLDRDFNTNTEIKVLKPNDPAYPVTIKPLRGDIPEQKLSLKVPRKRGEPIINIPKQSKIYKQFAIGIQGSAGIGSLKYDYLNLEKGFPSWYTINFSSKGIGTSLSYSTRVINVELAANYQNIYSYTSYLNVRFDHPEIRVDGNGNRVRIDNVQVERNFDRHASHRFQYAANFGFRIHFTKTIEMQPFIGVGKTVYTNKQYDADRFDETGSFKLNPMNYIQAGLRFEFLARTDRTFFIDLYYQENEWRPEGFFETVPYDNLRVDHKMYLFNFGYRIGL